MSASLWFGCIRIEKIFPLLEGVVSPQANYFSLGGCGVSAITMLPTDRLMALMG